MRKISCVVLTSIIVLAAQPCSAKALDYTCSDGTRLTAAFFESPSTSGEVILNFAHRAASLTLPQALSADGGRYRDGKAEFWIKGNSATLRRSNRPPTTCSTTSR